MEAARNLGIDTVLDNLTYTQRPFGYQLPKMCDKVMDRQRGTHFDVGYVLLIAWKKIPQHLGIVTKRNGEFFIVHALGSVTGKGGKVIEERITKRMENEQIYAIYKLRGVDYG